MKTAQEKGFTIPVKRRIEQGRYVAAYAKTLEPDRNGQIQVCYPEGKRSSWNQKSCIHEPQGFKKREPSIH